MTDCDPELRLWEIGLIVLLTLLVFPIFCGFLCTLCLLVSQKLFDFPSDEEITRFWPSLKARVTRPDQVVS